MAEKLWAANDLKEKYQNLLAATDEMLKAKFREMFGSLLSPKCAIVELSSVCKGRGEYGLAASADDYDELKGRYIRITDIDDFGQLNDEVVSPSVVDERFRLRVNDMLFARTGNTVGKTYLHTDGFCLFAGYLIRYSPDETKINPVFLNNYTHSKDYLDWVENTKKVGAQPNISAKQYDKMPILLPSIDLQREFVEIANTAEVSMLELKKSIASIDAVMRGLING